MGEDSAELVQAKLNLEANRRAHKVARLEYCLADVARNERQLDYARKELERAEARPLSDYPNTSLTNSENSF